MRRTSILASLPFLAAAACGKVNTLADSGPPDAVPIDADLTPDAAVSGTVKVTVIDPQNGGTPIANQTVVFASADGTVTEVKTDAMGKAHSDLIGGPSASVSTVWPISATSVHVGSIMGVVPGDDATLGENDVGGTDAGTFDLYNIPTSPYANVAGATMTAYGPCGSTSVAASATDISLTLSSDCKDNATDVVIVNTYQGTSYYALALPNVTFSMNGSANMGNGSWTYMGNTYVTGQIANIPAVFTDVSFDRSTHVNNGFDQSGSATPAGSPPSATIQVQAAPSTNGFVTISMNGTDGTTQMVSQIRQKIGGLSFTYGIDATAQGMPVLDKVAFDPATAKMSFTRTGTSAPDVAITLVSYKRGTVNYQWEMVVPPDVTSIVFPPLPTDLADANPKAGDTVASSVILLADSTNIADYDAIRANAFRDINKLFNSPNADIRITEAVSSAGGN